MKEATIQIEASVVLKSLQDFLSELQKSFRSVNDIDTVDQIDFYIACLDVIIDYFKKEKGQKE